MGRYFAPAAIPVPGQGEETLHGVAVDGKAQCGRLPFQVGGCAVHALSAFCHERGVVLAHEPIDPGQGAEKSEAELTVAPALLARIAWPGRVLTGDALFCQRHLALNLLRQERSKRVGIHAKRLIANANPAYLLKVLTAK